MARGGIGGTVILNVECPPSDDVVLTDISKSAAHLLVPFSRGILHRLFREKIELRRPNPGHDGALLITLFDEHNFTWKPMIHSNQLALPTFSGDLGDRGLRHHSALCLNQLTSAIIFVVSKDHRSVSVYRHGQAHLDLNADQLRSFALNAMLTKEHGFISNVCLQMLQMTIRSIGGTVLLNNHREQSVEGFASDGIAVNSSMEETDIALIFDQWSPQHDGALILDIADKGEFAPRVRSVQNHLLINPNAAPPAGHYGRGTRFFAAYCTSIACDALNIIVSEDRKTLKLKRSNARNTAMILENCVQSVFENAVSPLTFAQNLPPHLEANHLDRACIVLLRRFKRFVTSRLVLRFGGARVEANIYRFTHNSTVIDESLFASDAFRRSLSSEAEVENTARQLAIFFTSEWWTSGVCTFYVPRDAVQMAGPLIKELAATQKRQWYRRPFGQHLLQYVFRIENLLRRWPLNRPSDATEDAQNCGKELSLSEQEEEQSIAIGPGGATLECRPVWSALFMQSETTEVAQSCNLQVESDVPVSEQEEEPSEAGPGLVPVLIDDVAFHVENINFDPGDESLSAYSCELSFDMQMNDSDVDDETVENVLVDS